MEIRFDDLQVEERNDDGGGWRRFYAVKVNRFFNKTGREIGTSRTSVATTTTLDQFAVFCLSVTWSDPECKIVATREPDTWCLLFDKRNFPANVNTSTEFFLRLPYVGCASKELSAVSACYIQRLRSAGCPRKSECPFDRVAFRPVW